MPEIAILSYPVAKKIEDMFICLDRMYERVRHTDRQTDGQTAWRHRPRLHSIARQKFTGIVYRGGIFFHGEDTFVTPLVAVGKQPRWPLGSRITRPRRPLPIWQKMLKSLYPTCIRRPRMGTVRLVVSELHQHCYTLLTVKSKSPINNNTQRTFDGKYSADLCPR